MALKCPECGTMAHARTSSYEAPSVKRSWYQCQNLECSCTFTALESVPSQPESQDDSPARKSQTLGRYGSACTLKDRHAQ